MADTRGVRIEYGDYIVGAKEDFVPSSDYAEWFCDLSQLQQEKISMYKYINPCDGYLAILDGTGTAPPENPEEENMGFVSDTASIGYFEETYSPGFWLREEPEIEFRSSQLFTCPGIQLAFDTMGGTYPTELNVTWYRDTGDTLEKLSSKQFRPDSTTYFCSNYVQNFNVLKISAQQMNYEYVRFKIYSIDFGKGFVFYRNNLLSASVSRSISPDCTELQVGTGEFSIYDRDLFSELRFQPMQNVKVYFDNELLGSMVISSVTRDSNYGYVVELEDYVSLMENYTFAGGVYTNKNAVELLTEIFEPTKIPYYIDSSFNDITLSGHIPYTNCREALQLVCFAIQGVVKTADSETVNVIKLSEDVSQTIVAERMPDYPKVSENPEVSSVSITSHEYREYSKKEDEEDEGETTIEVKVDAYAKKTDISNALYSYENPVYNIRTQRTNKADIIESSANHVVYSIKAGAWDYIRATEYVHNEDVIVYPSETSSDTTTNKKEVTDCHLVDSELAEELSEKIYNYLNRTYSASASIAERKVDEGSGLTKDKAVHLGDVISLDSEFGENVTGYIVSESIDLTGGILVKDVEVW